MLLMHGVDQHVQIMNSPAGFFDEFKTTVAFQAQISNDQIRQEQLNFFQGFMDAVRLTANTPGRLIFQQMLDSMAHHGMILQQEDPVRGGPRLGPTLRCGFVHDGAQAGMGHSNQMQEDRPIGNTFYVEGTHKLILVLADDFSGAAEMAGIAQRLGFSAEVQTRFDPNGSSEVIALDTQTRALPGQAAVDRLQTILDAIGQLRCSWIYKKIDSVLRGHVLAETETIMLKIGMNHSVIIPANPSKGRVVRKGHYWIHQTPLHETVFAKDPTYPALTSDVLKLLGTARYHAVHSIASLSGKPSKGILVPDVDLPGDVTHWAEWVPSTCLGVGGVDFFKALLRQRHPEKTNIPYESNIAPPKSRVLACGSLAACHSGRLDHWRQLSRPVHLLPGEWLMSGENELPASWANPVLKSIKENEFCLIGIGEGDIDNGTDASLPAKRLVSAIHGLNGAHPIEQLLVEGGETALLLMQSLGHHQFRVVHSSPEGIPELVPVGESFPRIVPKPGSYPWPDEFLDAP